MKRIGIVASKMSKGNIVLYNVYVVLISILFGSFIFLVAGSTVIFALTILSYLGSEVMLVGSDKSWSSILAVCMITLTIIVSLVNLAALIINFRFRLRKEKDK